MRSDHLMHGPARGSKADRRVGRRSRMAGGGLVLVLLAVSVFAVWSSQATAVAAARAGAVNRLSDAYARAAAAVNAEQSLERNYRLDPAPQVRASHEEAAAVLVAALGEVSRDGDAADRRLVTHVLLQHVDYLTATNSLSVAVDNEQPALARKIERDYVDPAFGSLQTPVLTAAVDNHRLALSQLTRLQLLQARSQRVTPMVFLAGLLLSAVLASVSRGHRRLLSVERTRAVHAALHDALTGLPNRVLLADRLDQALRADARSGTCTGLLLIDLDRFKEVNDTFGHHCGDALLRQVGARLAGVLREVDTVARLGGDEFAVMLPDVDTVPAAAAVAGRLRHALEAPFDVDGVELHVEAGVGVVVSGAHGSDAAVLLQRADIAMYAAKTQNRGVSVYDPARDGQPPRKLALLGDLRRALERSELVLHYQPKISIDTGEVIGAEALVRWQHPDRGLVFPDAFIPLAEQTGLIGPLTRQVLDLALEQAARWAARGRPLPVAVNLSARNLLDEQLAAQVAQLLTDHGVPAGLLQLEVTESAIMTEPCRAQALLKQLAALGVRTSLDDFGAGYTSLGQLKNLPIHELKIDRSFVTTMTDDVSDALIVNSVIDLGHNLGLTIVAEGIEDESTLVALARLGCDIAQGYHLSRPLPAAAFDAWYDGQRARPNRPAARALRALPAGSTVPQQTQPSVPHRLR